MIPSILLSFASPGQPAGARACLRSGSVNYGQG
jgi:hypothetical protein